LTCLNDRGLSGIHAPEMIKPLRLEADPSGEDEQMTAPWTFEAFFEAERDGLFGALVLITGDRH